MNKKLKEKMLDKKWRRIEKEEGIKKPRSAAENLQRARDAHKHPPVKGVS